MEQVKSTIREIRQLCEQFNIHTLCALERSLYLGDGLTQQEIADKTRQTRASESRWEAWMVLNGLIDVEKGPRERRVTYTASGDDFLKKLRAILFQKDL